ncbi:T7SS effector LXG polymorphic toxin [Streptococcus sp. H31]|uniref:T7SS effector LXG polymorphic toxin n=1 Tax=Streptococcus huangxiaojuni TaxID=3237239 RepID=UPI0034A1E0FF
MVKMVLGSSDTQASSVASLADNYTSGFNSIISAIENLANADGLEGEAYTNVKTYGSTVVTPLAKGFILLADAAKTDTQLLPDRYRSDVGSEDLDEDTLTAQIDAYQSTIDANNTTLGKMEADDPNKSSVQSAVNDDTAEKGKLEEKLRKLREYDAASSGFFDDIADLETNITTGLSQLQTDVAAFNGSFTIPSKENLQWTGPINKGWEKKEFYDTLPEEVRDAITMKDIEMTDDGFFVINKPVSEILKSMGKTEVIIDGNPVSVDEVYDDHFIYGVKGEKGYSYSVLKMRELGDSQGNHGVSIPFIATDINELFKFSDSSNTIKNSDRFFKEFQRVIADTNQDADRTILDYFKNTDSDGSYLVADLFTDKVIKDNGSNTINSQPLDNILSKIDKIDEDLKNASTDSRIQQLLTEKEKLRRIPKYLEELNEKAGYDIYNPETGDVTVKDPNNLTHYERQAILAVSTGNVNYNSFAAEVEFHADAVDDWKSKFRYLPKLGAWRESAIRADMGLGEENESGFYDRYYNLGDSSVRRQKEAHGEK